jgi:EmrB/QacA subfamily drug resistance transporter
MTQKYKMFSIAGLGALLATFETSSINVALPSLSRHFGYDLDIISWIALCYTLTIAPTLLLFAALASRIGFKRVYFMGFTLFSIGSLVAGLADGFTLMLVGRVIQGIGASMNIALGPAVVSHAFPRGERGKGMGYVAMIVGLGLLSGPLIGGYLVTVSWRLIFLAPLAFSWTAYLILPGLDEWKSAEDRDSHSGARMNIVSGATLFIALASFLYAMKSINNDSVNIVEVLGSFACATVAAGVFFVRERNPRTNLIGYALFRNRNFSISVALMFLAFVATSSVLILVPFYVEQQLGFPPHQAGLFLAVTPFLMLLLAPISGRIADKIGSRIPALVGLSILTVGTYMLRDVSPVQGTWGLLYPLMVFGIGMGIFGTPNSSDLMGSVPEDKREIASGMLATTRSLSITFGVALSSALYVYWSERVGIALAYQNVFTISTVAAVMAVTLSLFRQPGRR